MGLLKLTLSNSCVLNINSESISVKLAVVSIKIGGCFAALVGDKDIGVPSFDKEGDTAANEANLIPIVISP